MAILADLSAEFGWQPGAWRRLPYAEFLEWVRELGRRREEEVAAMREAKARAEREQQAEEFRAQFRSGGRR